MTLVLELLAKYWKEAVLFAAVAGIALWITVLRHERDSARAQAAQAQASLKALDAQVQAQNAGIDAMKKASQDAQERSARALQEAQASIASWQAAAGALSAYKRVPQIVMKYRTMKVTTDECKVAAGLAHDAWAAAQRVREPAGAQNH